VQYWHCFQIFYKPLLKISRRPNDYPYDKAFQVPHSLNFYTEILYFNTFPAYYYIMTIIVLLLCYIVKQFLHSYCLLATQY
jgi:hypothetical protein